VGISIGMETNIVIAFSHIDVYGQVQRCGPGCQCTFLCGQVAGA
jgi:hypothetical protein